MLKTVLGSKRVRGRKNRKKARNHAVRNAVTATHTRRRRRRSISVFDGPGEDNPAAAAAFEVPTAGVPTYFVASTAPVEAGLAGSGFGVGFAPSGSGMSLPPLFFSTRRTKSSRTNLGSLLVGRHQYGRNIGIDLFAQSVRHQLRERRNKPGRIVQSRAHLELRDAQPSRFLASFVIDLAERFHVIGNERHRHDANFSRLLSREVAQRAVQRRLQPFAGSDLALVAEPMMIGPSAAPHQKAHRLLNVPLIGITFRDDRHGDAVRAEDNLSAFGFWKSFERLLDLFDHRV